MKGTRDIRQGLFHTAVLTGNCGLATTLLRDAPRQEQPSVNEAGFPLGGNRAMPTLYVGESPQAQTVQCNREICNSRLGDMQWERKPL